MSPGGLLHSRYYPPVEEPQNQDRKYTYTQQVAACTVNVVLFASVNYILCRHAICIYLEHSLSLIERQSTSTVHVV
jgi:hypothetical protein